MKEIIIFICIAVLLVELIPEDGLRFLVFILGGLLFSLFPFLLYVAYIVPFILPIKR